MNRLQKRISIVFFSVLAFGISLQAQKNVELKYNVSKGDKYDFTIDMDQDIVFQANGQQMALDQLMTMRLVMNVTDVTADSLMLDNQLKGVKMTQGIFGMTVTYDSDDPATMQNPMSAKMGEEFTKIIGKTFFMSMDHKGNVGKMDLSGLTNNDIANNINSGAQFAVYPDGKVKVGDTWEKDIYVSKNSDMRVHAVYTLLKVSGKQATVGMEGTIKANTVEDMDLNLNGTQKGEIIVELESGWLVRSSIDQELTLDIEQNGQKYPATITGTIVTTSAQAN